MYLQIECVTLRKVKYSDKADILAAWSPQLGRVSLMLNAGAGKESRRRRALTMPLSLIGATVDVRPGKDILTVKEMRAAAVTPTVSSHPLKASIAMFVAEVLTTVLRESGQGDTATWEFIKQSVSGLEALENNISLANYPLWFLYRLCEATGVQPDAATYMPGRLLDLREGVYRVSAPLHSLYLNDADSRFASLFSRITIRHLHKLRLDNMQRHRALETLIGYFGLHHTPLNNLRSLPVLQALFH